MTIRGVRGTRDILPDEIPVWQTLERAAHDLLGRYAYREIRTPVFEETELFARGIGAETDIVTKEMYTFDDRDGSSLTLRPEATAGIVRAVIEHNLMNTDPALKVYALGPMFRRERPQKGRYRQFHQLDVEAFGFTSPTIDAEMIEVAIGYLEACGVTRHELVLNSVGDRNCRPAYVETLREALREHAPNMCGDCQRRTETNPLRVLDSKRPEDAPLIAGAPLMIDHLSDDAAAHFAAVRAGLDLLGIDYEISPRLVRGLDYYLRTTFEFAADALDAAQNAVGGGGRYDGLVEQLGGPATPGIGFALGVDRILLACDAEGAFAGPSESVSVFVVDLTGGAEALRLLDGLARAGIDADRAYDNRSVKAQFKAADRSGARLALVVGDDELAADIVQIKDLVSGDQHAVARPDLLPELRKHLP